MSENQQPLPHDFASRYVTAQQAHQQLQQQFGAAAWYCGSGIRVDRETYAIRVNVNDAAAAANELPNEILGVPVEVLADIRYEARSGS
jgi:hypothetical protein